MGISCSCCLKSMPPPDDDAVISKKELLTPLIEQTKGEPSSQHGGYSCPPSGSQDHSRILEIAPPQRPVVIKELPIAEERGQQVPSLLPERDSPSSSEGYRTEPSGDERERLRTAQDLQPSKSVRSVTEGPERGSADRDGLDLVRGTSPSQTTFAIPGTSVLRKTGFLPYWEPHQAPLGSIDAIQPTTVAQHDRTTSATQFPFSADQLPSSGQATTETNVTYVHDIAAMEIPTLETDAPYGSILAGYGDTIDPSDQDDRRGGTGDFDFEDHQVSELSENDTPREEDYEAYEDVERPESEEEAYLEDSDTEDEQEEQYGEDERSDREMGAKESREHSEESDNQESGRDNLENLDSEDDEDDQGSRPGEYREEESGEEESEMKRLGSVRRMAPRTAGSSSSPSSAAIEVYRRRSDNSVESSQDIGQEEDISSADQATDSHDDEEDEQQEELDGEENAESSSDEDEIPLGAYYGRPDRDNSPSLPAFELEIDSTPGMVDNLSGPAVVDVASREGRQLPSPHEGRGGLHRAVGSPRRRYGRQAYRHRQQRAVSNRLRAQSGGDAEQTTGEEEPEPVSF